MMLLLESSDCGRLGCSFALRDCREAGAGCAQVCWFGGEGRTSSRQYIHTEVLREW